LQRKVILSLLLLSATQIVAAQSIDSTKRQNHTSEAFASTKKPVQKNPADSSLSDLSIFQLIDSLVQLPNLDELGSTLVARFGYNSNIVALSRTVGLNQFGLTPGISYYHKSGLYLDATAYWSQEYSPNLYLTIPSIGYIKTVKKWTLNLEYSKYLFSLTDSAYNSSYTNSIGLSNFFDIKPFLFRLDYSLYFGEKSAHRIMPGVMLNLEKKNWHGFRRILLYPSFNVLLGNETWQISQYIPNATTLTEIVRLVSQHKPLYRLQTDNYNKFGVLNYSVSLPLSVAYKNWTFLLSYTYNFQQVLPGEPITITNSGYLTFSISKYFNFKSNSVLTDLLKMTK
jgi:hypothetical protein